MMPCTLTSEHFSAWKSVINREGILLQVELNKTIPNPKSEAFVKDHSDLFLEVLYRVLIHPQLSSIYDKSKSHFSKSESGTTRDKYSFKPSLAFTAFRDVLVSRGGLCYILLQSFQTDSIFAVKSSNTLIESPWSFFRYEAESGHGRAKNASRMLCDLEKVEDLVLMVQEWLDAFIESGWEYHNLVSDVGNLLYHHSLQFELRRRISKKDLTARLCFCSLTISRW